MRGRKKIPATDKQKVEAFFRNDYIVVRNITRRIAEAARGYVWDFGVDPKDALHVATAVDAGLALFNTFDKDLLKKSEKVGDPPLTIQIPQWSAPKLPIILPRDPSGKKS